MKKLLFAALIFSLAFLAFQCKPYKPESQGITGTVTWEEGNQMPSISEDGKTDSKRIRNGIQRVVRIYPLIKIEDLKIEEGLYTSVAKSPITEVETDDKGRFSVKLTPGRYSVLVVEEGGLFGNIFDGDGNVQPVTVKEHEWTLLDIAVNYKAVY